MTDYCWLCERKLYKPHPTIPNVMSGPKRRADDRPMVCDKHKKVIEMVWIIEFEDWTNYDAETEAEGIE